MTKRQLEDAAKCEERLCRGCEMLTDNAGYCAQAVAQTALTYRSMLADVADTLDTITDIIDESGEWGNINALTTLETLYKAQAMLKESEVDGNGEINKYAK